MRTAVGTRIRVRPEEWEMTAGNEEENEMGRVVKETQKVTIVEGIPRTQITCRSNNWFDEKVTVKRRELSQLSAWNR